MKVKTNTLGELLSPLRQYFQRDRFTREDVNENPPLRSSLLTIEQMEHLAVELSSAHQLSYKQAPEQLLRRLAENEEMLSRVTALLQEAVRGKTPVMPAGEWLLDNLYLIEEQIRTGKRYLPKGYSKGLPKLRAGSASGYPRVYDLAIQIISHSDGHVDMQRLSRFIQSYQKQSPLTLGELWAVPIMLRLALIENLSRVAARIGIDRIDADLAHHWADRIIETSEKDPKDIVLVIADMARSTPPMVSSFVAELTRKLQWKGPNLTFVLNWIEQHLSETGFTINSLVLAENQKQAADQVSMSNSINSLRFLSKMDWREFVETMSVVEQTLRQDLMGIYPAMDFHTRDNYRHHVEIIAKQSRVAEQEVARTAIELAQKSFENDHADKRRAHVGYYLIGDGAAKTRRLVKLKLSFGQKLLRTVNRSRYSLYVAAATLITFSLGAALVWKADTDGVSTGLLYAVAVFGLLATSHFAFAIVNWLATMLVKPSALPKMNFSKGIPESFRTLVVVPTIIANPAQAEQLINDLEVRFLSNRDTHLHYALLTDFADAENETLPDDAVLLDTVQRQIIELNQKYNRPTNDLFFLFHRPRQWNAADKIWMGYERKRGKLGELNQLLRGEAYDRFSLVIGDAAIYTQVKYVITLDSDTQLPREAAWKLVGILAHPLNQAVYNPRLRRITEGYGIVQPRTAISLHGATRSQYSRMHENDAGIDPYTRITSDVYQDVFSEGSFVGKGIYDVDAFEKVLRHRFPENRILSHDLLEGSYARCGFASDVQFYEEYPSRYREDIVRRHRWIRGDWQIGNWALPWVPDANHRWQGNSIAALSRWKIFDNLRRSLVPVAFMALLIMGWTILPAAWFWTLSVIGFILLPPGLMSLWSAWQKPREVGVGHHVQNAVKATYKSILQSLFTIVCLPYEALISLDAIFRTLWRVNVSHKKLLQWNPSSFTKKRTSFLAIVRMMKVAPILAAAFVFYFIAISAGAVWVSTPLLLLWFTSPLIVWRMSLPLRSSRTQISEAQKMFLRELARKTWSFFVDLIGPGENWLPPDNLQQYPIPVIAHRTSPTNMGMALLSNLTAFDFGYSTTAQLIERTTNTLNTMNKLERYEGHFYNWYDTQSLKILTPKYVSTVDSGNLAGHLLTLRQGLLAIPGDKVIGKKFWAGLHDTWRVLCQEMEHEKQAEFEELERAVIERITNPPLAAIEHKRALEDLITRCSAWMNVGTWSGKTEKTPWANSLEAQLQQGLAEINLLMPWLQQFPIPEGFKETQWLETVPSLSALVTLADDQRQWLSEMTSASRSDTEKAWLSSLNASLQSAATRAKERVAELSELASTCFALADMSYDFLYDKSLHLLAIGYNVESHHRDSGYYDLLASESRLAAFVAIAQGKLPQESWFALGRSLTTTASSQVLLSWSGSMFEYLMPLLVMPTYENTLLDETYRGVVKRQIEFGQQQGIPWGVSESCYNIVDANLNYQYRAFGVPGLGLKRGLGQDLVIAPYATALALMVDPESSAKNLEKLTALGFQGNYGLFESIDYTRNRLPRNQSNVLIQTFMVHHQSMTLLSLAYLLLDQPMQKRFEADPQCQTALLLLQEQVPKTTGFYSAPSDEEEFTTVPSDSEIRVLNTPDTAVPEIQLLSNGRYHVMVTNAGGGYSRWHDTAVTRWREDTTCDNWGTFCYVRDLESGKFWSTGHQPTCQQPKSYEAVFSQGRAEFRRHDDRLETYTEIIVSPEDDVEIRRIHIINQSDVSRNIELTSYAEVVMALPQAEASHPAFSNLFVQTEINRQQHAILCTRRPRSSDERPPWMLHLMKVNGVKPSFISYETDRDKFIGRGNTAASPNAMTSRNPLSDSQGSVLDPIVAIQSRMTLKPDETITVDIITGITISKQDSQSLIDKYQDRHLRNRAFELSWTHSQVVLRQIGATEADAQFYSRLASSVIYSNPALRASPDVLAKNQKGQSGLWSFSISGDLPIVLLQVSDSSNITLVKQLMQARAFWQLKGLMTDLVILNEDYSSYRQVLQDQIQGLIAGFTINVANQKGGIFLRSGDQVSAEDRVLLQTVARVIIADTRGSLLDQVNRRLKTKTIIPFLPPVSFMPSRDKVSVTENLQFDNGLGGFNERGDEYVITTNEKRRTPVPWVNVLANPSFGTLISESGSSYTWSENAHEFRLTPWENDPVTDSGGEGYYLRDEETGQFWSPMPLPVRGKSPYITKHGFGYTVFQHSEDGINSNVCVYVDRESSIKFVILKVKNHSGRPRKLSATGYVEWVLGAQRAKSAAHIITDVDPVTGALIARNPYNTEFQNRVAFLDVDDALFTFTADRTEFLGRNGSIRNPEALRRVRLSNKTGAGVDPCAAILIPFELDHGREREIIFRTGMGSDQANATETIRKFRGSEAALRSLEKVKLFWKTTLGSVQIETPDPALNLLANGWLVYQVISSRLWGRTGFYQSGGAFGFRDQLQDVLSLLHVDAQATRQHLLLSASRQFPEGDVQHWWHPPLDRGVRTQCSDDFLWLPYVTSRYVSTSGDEGILDEKVSFVEGRKLNAKEESYYDLPLVSELKTSLYDHCKRSIRHAFRYGPHGLPLIGSGDWNDGMNLVGIEGQGESVWLGFFLFDVLKRFIPLARLQKDNAFIEECEKQSDELQKNINKNGWDGSWYLRAYFDNGSKLGSSGNVECKIDSLAQSWSVLSGAGEKEKSKTGMQAAESHLVDRSNGLIKLLEPPFDRSEADPGYIKGYVPGVRENGGQYTHAAIWMVMAFAKLGDQKRTWELLNMINPVNHGRTPEEIAKYKIEPYVIAADVYGVAPYNGRGGWSWYTGSAGWMYQLILESFLGLRVSRNELTMEPCVPEEWETFTISIRYRQTNYTIEFRQGVKEDQPYLLVDELEVMDGVVRMVDDRAEHKVKINVSWRGDNKSGVSDWGVVTHK